MENIVKALIADLDAIMNRIKDDLGFNHPAATQAHNFVEGAREELKKHPGAPVAAPSIDASAPAASSSAAIAYTPPIGTKAE